MHAGDAPSSTILDKWAGEVSKGCNELCSSAEDNLALKLREKLGVLREPREMSTFHTRAVNSRLISPSPSQLQQLGRCEIPRDNPQMG